MLKAPEPSTFSRILAVGASRGSRAVTNDEIAGPIDSSDEWIRQRTGLVTRSRAAEGEEAVDFATAAALEALAKAGVNADQVDAIIVATISNPVPTPSLSTLLSARIGALGAAAYDISAACAGYTYAVAQADALIRSGLAKYVLAIGAEKLSEWIDPTDRSISFLLGDGAGAALIGPSDTPGISKSYLGSDGSAWDKIYMTNTLFEYRDAKGNTSDGEDSEIKWPTIRQEGQAVFRWAVWEMAKVAKETLDIAGVKPEELAAFIPHQANMRIIDEFAKQLKLPSNIVIARDIETTGNTSAASIPLATHRLLEEHPELSGGLALQIGFGAGLVYGAQVVVLP